jgi:hypothetical protein
MFHDICAAEAGCYVKNLVLPGKRLEMMTNFQFLPSTAVITATVMTVIVKNDIRAYVATGQVVINLSRHPPEQRKKKMKLALSTFREYGWEIDDQREQKGELKKAPPRG